MPPLPPRRRATTAGERELDQAEASVVESERKESSLGELKLGQPTKRTKAGGRPRRPSVPPPPSRRDRDREADKELEVIPPSPHLDATGSNPIPIPPPAKPATEKKPDVPAAARRDDSDVISSSPRIPIIGELETDVDAAAKDEPEPADVNAPSPAKNRDDRLTPTPLVPAQVDLIERPANGDDDEPSSPSSEDHHWPAPARPAPEYDPHDWNAEGAQPPKDGRDPPPTRLAKHVAATVEPHKAASVVPIPEVPEAGWWPAAKYAVAFARARWQRRAVVKKLRSKIAGDTADLDEILGRLGAEVRAKNVREPVLATENRAIDDAEKRRERADHACAELSNRQAEENARYVEIDNDRQGKVAEADGILDTAQSELGSLEAQRRSLRDKRKAVERKQKGAIKAASDRQAEAEKATVGETKAELQKAAEELRSDAAKLDPERQDIERRLTALEKPISQATAKVEALRAELESARRSLNDAKEGHRLRLAEIEAEQGRRSRELAQAEAEIQRRLVTLGTLINLNRIDREELIPHYNSIDGLRGAIGARSNEIDRLTAERAAYDRASIIRGSLVLGGAGLLLLTLVIIAVAAL